MNNDPITAIRMQQANLRGLHDRINDDCTTAKEECINEIERLEQEIDKIYGRRIYD